MGTRISLLAAALIALEALAQPTPREKVSPSLPPQASEKAQATVSAKTSPTVSLTAPAGGALYTAPASVLLEAAAVASSGGRSIAGVEFFSGATSIGVVSTAPYTLNWSNVTAGSYDLTARATDNLGVTATSAPVAIIVNAPPTVALTSPGTNALFTAPAAITLMASASDADGTIAQVEFFQGATLLATVTSAPYAFSVDNLPGGAYSFTARATDNRGASVSSAPVAVVVNVAPTISLASPANNATFTAPASITLTAEAADSDGTIARVDFYDGMTLIATRTTAPYSIVLTDMPQGAYSLSARVTDNHGAVVTSAAVSVTVNSAVAQIYFIHTDHLNTPRLITNNVGQAVWSWNNDDPFGANVPNQNPSALGDFECNLRLPGQYFDRETNLHYNYFREYDSQIGRYLQSDPIGLGGGINTYVYAFDPLTQIDPFGLMGRGGTSNQTAFSEPIRFGGGSAALSTKQRFPGSPCGPEGSRKNFPSNFGAWSFAKPCRNHDNCYDRCGTTKAICDRQIYDDMLAECNAVPPATGLGFARIFCKDLAHDYFIAIVLGGSSAYKQAQSKCKGC
jgi:RHS repeat-associated protein